MTTLTIINRINNVLKEFFNDKSNPKCVKAKSMMELFIQKGIFPSNHKDGLPIRKLLRGLDEFIPYVVIERKTTNRNWFFKDISGEAVKNITAKEETNDIIQRYRLKINKSSRSDSDEYYIIGLCNEVLGKTALQQYKFDFLLGDSGRKLPVDAYYKGLNLVVEYCEYQHTGSVPLFDDTITVSWVTRGVQRQIYDQ